MIRVLSSSVALLAAVLVVSAAGADDLETERRAWIVGGPDGQSFRSGGPSPGRIPTTMTMRRVAGNQLELVWEASVCSGATDYAVYEGPLGDWTWTNHHPLACSDTDGDLRETVLPSLGNRFYLVVPLGTEREGSYGP